MRFKQRFYDALMLSILRCGGILKPSGGYSLLKISRVIRDNMMFLTCLLPHFERLERLYINISSDLAPLCFKK